jgi:hypothetical protein
MRALTINLAIDLVLGAAIVYSYGVIILQKANPLEWDYFIRNLLLILCFSFVCARCISRFVRKVYS